MNLKDLIQSKGLSVYRVAANGGLPYTTINSVVNGSRNFDALTLKNIKKIANGLDMSLIELINQIDESD